MIKSLLFINLSFLLQNKEYRVDLNTKKCNVTTLTFPFRPIGVPEGAKFLFEAEIGAAQVPLEHLTAVTFGGEFKEDHGLYFFEIVTILREKNSSLYEHY